MGISPDRKSGALCQCNGRAIPQRAAKQRVNPERRERSQKILHKRRLNLPTPDGVRWTAHARV
jgi:hypothetical protein